MTTHVYNNKVRKAEKVNTSDEYRLDKNGRFQIMRYDQQPAFASFLPGVGGPDGVPLWCLYVNRGQAICSYGVGNKDNPVVEFLPANWAYQLTGIQGFRTFCKVDDHYYEPFQDNLNSRQYDFLRRMWIQMDRLVLHEENRTLGLRFEVTYFSPVNKPIGSLVRMLTITNTSSHRYHLEGLDGLPLIIPAGFTDIGLKTMRRIHEAYASVRKVAGYVPFYAAKVMTHDEAEVQEVCKGNFYASWLSEKGHLLPIEPYYDSDLIFGHNRDLVTPHHFIEKVVLDRNCQVAENKLACAMAPFHGNLEPDETMTLVALSGMAPNESMLISFLSDFTTMSDFERESRKSRESIESLTDPAFMVSSSPQLDAYTRQNFLDNILRGGVPELLPSKTGPTLLHLYSRRHGDAERDYNFFDLPACPLSSGEGNYRDICQNRRSDIWFYSEAWDREIRMFVSLLQADGYNPLSIKGYRWRLDQSDPISWCPSLNPPARMAFKKLVSGWFLPGELLAWSDYYQVDIPERSKWLSTVLSQCRIKTVASGHEGGYWIDHWTYVIDLLEAFKAVYPDKIVQVLTENADIEWFSEPARVVPRQHKYMHRKNGPLQLDAVADAPLPPVELPPVTLAGKLCGLLAIKSVSLDYEGRGIEMEAGRPAWDDAMNGLPGLFGSSTCETVETLRLAEWLLQALPEMPDMDLPVEVAGLIEQVTKDLKAPYDWERSAKIRETYREKIYENHSDKRVRVSSLTLHQLLKGLISRFEKGVNSAIDSESGLLHTYYSHQPLDAKERQTNAKDFSFRDGFVPLDITRFQSEPLPLFLEGQVHWLRVCTTDKAREIYHAVRKSPLLDKKLQMYKLNECLQSCPPEIGRARTFSRGWFENESIWLHMSTKYLLELVKKGLYDEFYTDAQTMLVPFMDPAVYGRSILENSSFIASSDCPDPAARGRGFVARLSGTTAEFIHLWLLLTLGKEPFTVRDGQLNFVLRPALPAAWFTEEAVEVFWQGQQVRIPENAFACALLGTVLLVYHNPSRHDTYGRHAVQPVRYRLDNRHEVSASHVVSPLAEQIRQRTIHRIDVWLE
jgi:hypothetical protein